MELPGLAVSPKVQDWMEIRACGENPERSWQLKDSPEMDKLVVVLSTLLQRGSGRKPAQILPYRDSVWGVVSSLL